MKNISIRKHLPLVVLKSQRGVSHGLPMRRCPAVMPVVLLGRGRGAEEARLTGRGRGSGQAGFCMPTLSASCLSFR